MLNMNDQENFYYSEQHYLSDIELLEKFSKQPIVIDDIKLKQLSCSHIEAQKFIMRNGCEMIRCKACGLWDSGDTTL